VPRQTHEGPDPGSAPALSAPPPERGGQLTRARLGGADLRGLDLCRTELLDADLARADLSEARLHGARLRRADLTSARLVGVRAVDLDLEAARLPGAELRDTSLVGCVLLDADLRGARLDGVDLRRADLRGADLRGATLSGVDLTGADLAGAHLDEAVITEVRARGCRLSRVKGLSEETRAELVAAGAYEGLPPWAAAIARAANRAQQRLVRATRRRIAERRERIEERQRAEQEVVVLPPEPAQGLADRLRQAWRQRVAKARMAAELERTRLEQEESQREAEAARRVEEAEAEKQRRAEQRVAAADRRAAEAQRLEDRKRLRKLQRSQARAARLAAKDAARQARTDAARVQESQEASASSAREYSRQLAQDRRRMSRLQRIQARARTRARAAIQAERYRAREAAAAQQLLENRQIARAEADRLRQAQRAAAAEREAREAAELELASRLAAMEAAEQAARDEQRRAETAARQAGEDARKAEADAQESRTRAQHLTAADEAQPADLPRPLDSAAAPEQPTLYEAVTRAREDAEAARQRTERERVQARARAVVEEAERAQAEAEAREAAATAAEAEARRAQAERASAELEAKVRRQRAMLERAQRRQDQLEAAALARRTRLVEREQRIRDRQAALRTGIAAAARQASTLVATFSSTAAARLSEGANDATAWLEHRARGQAARREAALERDEALAQRQARAALEQLGSAEAASAPLPAGLGPSHAPGTDLRSQKLDRVDWARAELDGVHLDGARLNDADLTEASLVGATLDDARMRRVLLSGATLRQATAAGASLRDADLRGADLRDIRLVDADLRGADLQGADLSAADLTGADLRRARLDGAIFRSATLVATRLTDVDLDAVVLDEAMLDQADLAGTTWTNTSVVGARIGGALGLSSRERRALAERGALVGDQGFELFSGRLGNRQLQAAVLILALGTGAYLAARLAGSQDVAPEDKVALAEGLRQDDPASAAEAYAELAAEATKPRDRVGYLLEAALLSDQAGLDDDTQELYEDALSEAGEDLSLVSDVRLRAAGWQAQRGRWTEVQESLGPILVRDAWSTESRARAVVLHRQADTALGSDAGAVDELFDALTDLPEAEAELRMAIADLVSARGDSLAALDELQALDALDLPQDLQEAALATRARVLDRAGDLDGAALAWANLEAAASLDRLVGQRARLALAEVRRRQGRPVEAQELTQALSGPEVDAGIRAQALMLQGRLLEQGGAERGAIEVYTRVLALESADSDTRDEARMALAGILLASADPDAAQARLVEVDPEGADDLMAQARLGRAQALLESGEVEAALEALEALVVDEAGAPATQRRARIARGQAMVAMGEIPDAVSDWRALLVDAPTAAEKRRLELLLAHALLQAGDRDEARIAFGTLAEDADVDVQAQGTLGLAEVARAEGQREQARALYRQVADRPGDPGWRIQALEELADLATETGSAESALEAWREVLAIVPPGHPTASAARLSEILALADLDRLDEAADRCVSAIPSAQAGPTRHRARLACGEIRERAGRLELALTDYQLLLRDDAVDEDHATDAALGAARSALELGRSADALAATARGLAMIEEPAARLTLLSTQVRAAEALGDEALLAEAIAARDALAEEIPDLAGPVLVDAAVRSRAAGRTDEAIDLLRRAVTLPMAEGARAAAWTELGDAWLEQTELDDAAAAYAQAAALADNDPLVAFTAQMGQAEVARRRGDLEKAIELLEEVSPPDELTRQWWMETLATVLTEAGHDDALETWEDLASTAPDAGTKVAALIGQADLLYGEDRYADALPVYTRALQEATDPVEAGWAGIGRADALAALDRSEEADELLGELMAHRDPEVALQAHLRSAQHALQREAWAEALAQLDGLEAHQLGPGWDASLVETRTVALRESGDLEGAAAEWQSLSARWPTTEEEAQMPAWLGLADLALADGDREEALRLVQQALSQGRDPGWRSRAEDLQARIER